MTLDDLEDLIVRAVRYRTNLWVSDPKLSDKLYWSLASSVLLDGTRGKVLIDRVRRNNDKEALRRLQQDFWYFEDQEVPNVETYWPYGLRVGHDRLLVSGK